LNNKKASLSTSTFWYVAGNLISRGVGFILLPVYSNLISPFEFGKYSLIISAYAITAVLFNFGMAGSLTKFYLEKDDENERRKIFSAVFTFIFVFCIVLTSVIFLISKNISVLLLNNPGDYNLIMIASAALLFETLGLFWIQLLKTIEESGRVVVLLSVSAAVNLFFNLFFLYVLQYGIKGILLAMMISNAVLFFIMLPQIKKQYTLSFERERLFRLISFSIPFVAGGFFSIGTDVIDRFFLNYFLGEADVGIYSFSYRIAMVMNIFVLALGSAWTPYGIRRFHEGNYRSDFGKSFTKVLAIALLILIVISVLSDDLFQIKIGNGFLFDPVYSKGVIIIPIVLTGYIFKAFTNYFSLYPYISGRSRHFLISDVIAFLINILLNYILIPSYGIMGAAAATAIGFGSSMIYLFLVSKGKVKIDYQPAKIYTIIIAAAGAMIVTKAIESIVADIVIIAVILGLYYKLSDLKL